MPRIEFNSVKKEIDTENLRTVAELIPSIKSNHLNSTEYLTHLFINGEEVTSKNQSLYLDKLIEENDIIQFKVSNSKNIILETVEELPKYIDSLIETINLSVKFSEKEQYTLSLAVLGEIIEKIDAFIQLITQVHKSLITDSDKKLDSGQSIKELEIHLLSITKAILVAQKREDHIMLVDLLDYELKDNLTQWKITVIPQIKRLNTI